MIDRNEGEKVVKGHRLSRDNGQNQCITMAGLTGGLGNNVSQIQTVRQKHVPRSHFYTYIF